jgi:hypothetical protein
MAKTIIIEFDINDQPEAHIITVRTSDQDSADQLVDSLIGA